MRLIFSKDRAAQLDLLLRSLRRHAFHEPTRVIWSASDWFSLNDHPFWDGYQLVPVDQHLMTVGAEGFDMTLRQTLLECPDETVTFFCDDDVVFHDIPEFRLGDYFGSRSDLVLTHSLRVGVSGEVWRWQELERTDEGFPGSIDGHTFRIDDVWEMIGDHQIEDPTALEDALVAGCERLAEQRPFMAAFAEQKLVGVPVNRVSTRSGCENGLTYPQAPEELNDRFLGGERIDLNALDFSDVTGCHHEIEFQWRRP